MKKAIFIIAVVALVIVTALVSLIAVWGEDIAPPDTSDLMVAHPEIPPEENAYTHFSEAGEAYTNRDHHTLLAFYLDGDPVDETEPTAVIDANRAVLETFSKGLECERCVAPEMRSFTNKTRLMFARACRSIITNTPLPFADMEFTELDTAYGELGQGTTYRANVYPNQLGRWLYYSYAAGDRTVLERKCRTDCHIRGLLLIIPLRLYRQDHGKLPAALSELVPDYLPAIPVDPFDGKPFRYLPDKGVVYSVGSDTRDSGGSTELEELYNESPKRIQRWYTEDAVFSLAPREITQATESP